MPLDRSVGNYFDSSASFLRRVARWTGPASYVSGGEPVTAATFGLGRIVALLGGMGSDASGALRLAVYNPATNKIAWYVDGATGFTEVAGGVNLSTFSAPIEVIGQ